MRPKDYFKKIRTERGPSDAFRSALRVSLMEYIKANPLELPIQEVVNAAGTWRKKMAIALATFAIVCTGAVGTVFAAQTALPGDTLYGIKLAADQLSVDITRSPAVRANVANRRIEEIKQVLSAQPVASENSRTQADIQSALHQYQSVLQDVTAETDTTHANANTAIVPPPAIRDIIRKAEGNATTTNAGEGDRRGDEEHRASSTSALVTPRSSSTIIFTKTSETNAVRETRNADKLEHKAKPCYTTETEN